MSFVWRNISKIGEQTWVYKTEDSFTSIMASGYFNRASGKFRIGERIAVTRVSNQGLPAEAFLDAFDLVVVGETAGVVSVSLVSAGDSGAVFDVTDYGAVGDGVTDDSAALQAAHNAAAAASPRGRVKLPIKRYRINSGVNLKASMFGEGGTGYDSTMARACIEPYISDGSAALWAIDAQGMNFRDFAIEGQNTGNPNPSGGTVTQCIGLQLGKCVALISNVTRTNPVVITTKYFHTWTTGDVVTIENLVGCTELNGNSYTATRISATQVSLNVNGTGFAAAYVSGGIMRPTDSTVADVSRGQVRGVTARNLAVGFHLQGWLNRHEVSALNCTLGFDGSYLNTCYLDLFTENCWQAFQLLGCSALYIERIEDEGQGANQLGASSTIDFCSYVRCAMYSGEGSRNGTTPWMTWGGVSYCNDIYFDDGFAYAGGGGTASIAINNVTRYRVPTCLGGISVTANSKPFLNSGKEHDVALYGARGDGVTDDTAAIAYACDRIEAEGGGVLAFSPGKTYYLGTWASNTSIFYIANTDNFHVNGRGAKLVLQTTAMAVPAVFAFDNCRNTRILALRFEDTGTNLAVDWQGACCLSYRATTSTGARYDGHSIRDCRADSVVTFVRAAPNAGTDRVADIKVSDCFVSNLYYGINLQDNGDDCSSVNFTAHNVRRFIFVYGVDGGDFRGSVRQDSGLTSSAIVNISRMNDATSTDTKNVHCDVKFTGTTSSDLCAFIIFNDNAPATIHRISGCSVNIDAGNMTLSGGQPIVRFRAYNNSGVEQLGAQDWYCWENIKISGMHNSSNPTQNKVDLRAWYAQQTLLDLSQLSGTIGSTLFQNFGEHTVQIGPNKRMRTKYNVNLTTNPVLLQWGWNETNSWAVRIKTWCTGAATGAATNQTYREDILMGYDPAGAGVSVITSSNNLCNYTMNTGATVTFTVDANNNISVNFAGAAYNANSSARVEFEVLSGLFA